MDRRPLALRFALRFSEECGLGLFEVSGSGLIILAVVVLLAFAVLVASELSLLVFFLRLTRAYGLYGAEAFFLERVAPSLVVLVPPPGRFSFSEYEKTGGKDDEKDDDNK